MENISHERAAEFRKLYKQPMPGKVSPSLIDDLSLKLIVEEVRELCNSANPIILNVGDDEVKMRNFVEVFDALADIEVVVSQAYHSWGVTSELREEINAEVHRSNMSKAVKLPKDESIQSYVDEAAKRYDRIVQAELNESLSDDVYNVWVLKNLDGKVLKPSTFSPPDIRSIIERELASEGE